MVSKLTSAFGFSVVSLKLTCISVAEILIMISMSLKTS